MIVYLCEYTSKWQGLLVECTHTHTHLNKHSQAIIIYMVDNTVWYIIIYG